MKSLSSLSMALRRQVHFSTQRVDLQRAGIDVAIRGSSELEPGLVARVLMRTPLIAVAAPAYLAERGMPRSVRDLRQHRCLLGLARGELPQSHWIDRRGRSVHVEGCLASNDIAFLREAALDGRGVAYLPEMLCGATSSAAPWCRCSRARSKASRCWPVVYAEREFLPPQVRAFVDTATAWARNEPETGLWPPPTAEAPEPSHKPREKRRDR